MSYAEETNRFRGRQQSSAALAREWRKLTRAATLVALLTSPAFFLVLYDSNHLSLVGSIVLTLFAVVLFRGLVEVIVRRVIPSPSLIDGDQTMRAQDIIARRRYWFWRTSWRRLPTLAVIGFLVYLGYLVVCHAIASVGGVKGDFWHPGREISAVIPADELPTIILSFLEILVELPLILFANVFLFLGPFLLMAGRSIKSYEPGDASWGVKLQDVRGQADAKQEIDRVISLWQSGEEFERAGGKRERGLLFLGAPGTGKTMISKAIATSFNCPFVTIPGSGFAGMFIGMDTLTVWLLARRARKLARKWGGQCIVFIDEIDAVGMRRQALGNTPDAGVPATPQSMTDINFYGPNGSLTPSGDLVIETRQWRDQIFAQRAASEPHSLGFGARLNARLAAAVPGGGMGMFGGGGNALNALLVVMDGMNEPPAFRKWYTNRFNTFLDAMFVIPQKLGGVRLRLPAARPRKEEIYFIGACNVPIDALDPALIRPGRMGRHIWFRTPTKEDRKDIFDLYITKVDHEPSLDTDHGRDELARITAGYSPAMIEQSCSMALTIAQAEGRPRFARRDILDAMTTVESGTATGIEYIEEETRAVAIHEAGHAAAGHVYLGDEMLSTRLSIKMRGGSLGHYQGMDKDERFSHFRGRVMGNLVMTLGAMAAEHVFYGENSQGVSGDIYSATNTAAAMVGVWGMGPNPVAIDIRPREERRDPRRELPPERSTPSALGRLGSSLLGTQGAGQVTDDSTPEGLSDSQLDIELDRQDLVKRRLEQIGNQIMNRTPRGSALTGSDLIGTVLTSNDKRRSAAILLGQAYVTAYSLMATNREQIEEIARRLSEEKEIYGDDVTTLLNSVELVRPEIDLTDDTTWPRI
jgi:ATP-dependent Zn protease